MRLLIENSQVPDTIRDWNVLLWSLYHQRTSLRLHVHWSAGQPYSKYSSGPITLLCTAESTGNSFIVTDEHPGIFRRRLLFEPNSCYVIRLMHLITGFIHTTSHFSRSLPRMGNRLISLHEVTSFGDLTGFGLRISYASSQSV